MKNKIIFLLIVFIIFSGFISLYSYDQQSFSLKKDIVIGRDEVQENLITFGGTALIEGKVKSVVALGGTITVTGEVSELFGIGSKVTLESTAVVKGDAYIIGGTLNKEPGSTIKGDTVHFETSEDVSKILKQFFGNIFSVSLIPLILMVKLIIFSSWFLLALVVIAIFPKQITFGSSQINKSFGSIFGIGLLSIMIFVGAVIFSALLSIILVGIPFLLFFIVLGLIIQIFGRIVVFYFLGESLLKAFGKQKSSPIFFVIIGLILVTVVRFIPVIGFLFSLCLSIIGWGVVIKTKFGSTENWFRKKS